MGSLESKNLNSRVPHPRRVVAFAARVGCLNPHGGPNE